MNTLRLTKFTLIALAVAQVLDVITTEYALANGAHEVMTASSLFMEYLGPIWWLPKCAAVGILVYYALTVRDVSRPVAVFLGAVAKLYVLVLINNVFGFF